MDKQQRHQFIAAVNDYVFRHWNEEATNATVLPFSIHHELSTDQDLLIGASTHQIRLMDVEKEMTYILKNILHVPELPKYQVVSKDNSEDGMLHIPDFKNAGHEIYTLPANALDNVDYDKALAALQEAKRLSYLSHAADKLEKDHYAQISGTYSVKEQLTEAFNTLSQKEGIAPADIAALTYDNIITTIKNALPPEQQVEFMQELGKKMGLRAAISAKRGLGGAIDA